MQMTKICQLSARGGRHWVASSDAQHGQRKPGAADMARQRMRALRSRRSGLVLVHRRAQRLSLDPQMDRVGERRVNEESAS